MKEKKRFNHNQGLLKKGEEVLSQNTFAAAAAVLSFLLVFFSSFYSVYGVKFFTNLRLSGFTIGNKAARDYIASRNFVFVDKQATDALIKKQSSTVLKVFRFDNEKVLATNKKFEDFSSIYLSVVEKKKKDTSALKDYLAVINTVEMDFLITKVDPYIVIPAASNILDKLLLGGIVKIPSGMHFSPTDSIKVWKWNNGRKDYNEIKISKIITLSNIDKVIEDHLMYKNFPEKEKYAIHLLVRNFITEDVFYDQIQTSSLLNQLKKNIKPVTVKITKGDKIITKGFPVTERQIQLAKALSTYPDSAGGIQAAGSLLYLLVLYTLGIILFYPLFQGKKRQKQYVYLFLVFISVYALYVAAAIHVTGIFTGLDFALFVPVALFSMLFSVILGIQAGSFLTLLFSLFLFIFPNTTTYGFLFSLLSGFAGSYFVRKAEKRLDLIRAGLYLALVNLILTLIIALYLGYDLKMFLTAGGIVVLNAFLCSIINLSLLPVLEHIMNLPTTFRLVELSDMSMPILKKMITLAPGTYSHSMSVANLAESAAREIGANALLARVGAYYHDIGKIDQSEYFIENQKGDNKHDDLKPSLSVAVIKSHVKIGIERGKEMGLPPEIIDIIAQHHGSGVINYFYIEAIKKELGNNRITKEDYSYNGTPPQSKEAGIVMMADSVEAASRVLKKPTIAKLDKFIWNTILEKVETGQLSNCNITFRELVIIKNSFIQILAGYFHSRIEYPKREGTKT